ncbi:MAG: HNH endonuclease [Methylophilaceae bacterium]
MCQSCNNTFNKPDGTPYIEVHHIIFMSEGGEDGLWNLAVLCAHHHRMAHFSDKKTCLKLQKTLLSETQARLGI